GAAPGSTESRTYIRTLSRTETEQYLTQPVGALGDTSVQMSNAILSLSIHAIADPLQDLPEQAIQRRAHVERTSRPAKSKGLREFQKCTRKLSSEKQVGHRKATGDDEKGHGAGAARQGATSGGPSAGVDGAANKYAGGKMRSKVNGDDSTTKDDDEDVIVDYLLGDLRCLRVFEIHDTDFFHFPYEGTPATRVEYHDETSDLRGDGDGELSSTAGAAASRPAPQEKKDKSVHGEDRNDVQPALLAGRDVSEDADDKEQVVNRNDNPAARPPPPPRFRIRASPSDNECERCLLFTDLAQDLMREELLALRRVSTAEFETAVEKAHVDNTPAEGSLLEVLLVRFTDYHDIQNEVTQLRTSLLEEQETSGDSYTSIVMEENNQSIFYKEGTFFNDARSTLEGNLVDPLVGAAGFVKEKAWQGIQAAITTGNRVRQEQLMALYEHQEDTEEALRDKVWQTQEFLRDQQVFWTAKQRELRRISKSLRVEGAGILNQQQSTAKGREARAIESFSPAQGLQNEFGSYFLNHEHENNPHFHVVEEQADAYDDALYDENVDHVMKYGSVTGKVAPRALYKVRADILQEHSVVDLSVYFRARTYVGCYRDSAESRAMEAPRREAGRLQGKPVSVFECAILCADRPFFALQGGGQCWCASELNQKQLRRVITRSGVVTIS
ncbi:unnamed protein product, partial [Amoebophrya sp. A120]